MKDSIPAFPDDEYHGMSLLDYFAAKAMQAQIASLSYHVAGWHSEALKMMASDAYAVADAMLKERAK